MTFRSNSSLSLTAETVARVVSDLQCNFRQFDVTSSSRGGYPIDGRCGMLAAVRSARRLLKYLQLKQTLYSRCRRLCSCSITIPISCLFHKQLLDFCNGALTKAGKSYMYMFYV